MSEYKEINEIIKEELKEKGYTNKLIDYPEFLSLYEPYRDKMTERDFANILGISYASYQNTRSNPNIKARINTKREIIKRLEYQMNLESRKYSKQELEDICKKNDVTLYELLCEIYQTYRTGNNDVIDKLMQRNSIYIGKSAIPMYFQEKYADLLLKESQKCSKNFATKYNKKSMIDDIASENLLYVLQNKGDIIENSDTEDEALHRIFAYMNMRIKYAYLRTFRARGFVSLDATISSDISRVRYEIVRDTTGRFKTSEDIINGLSIDNKDEIISEMSDLYDMGKKNTEVLELIIEKYHMKKEDLLEILKDRLSKQKINIDEENEDNYLGEEYYD